MIEITTDIIHGDCLEVLKAWQDNSFDLIVTSPPYADQRAKTYGGVRPEDYAEWFLPISKELLRVLKPTGTFILNIKEKVENGERHTYVIELILEMRKQGWLWTEEFVWHKKSTHPGKWRNRFRDAWERLLQFNKEKQFNMYQDTVMVPIGDWAKTRLKNLSETDKRRDNSKVGSGFGKNISNWVGREMVYPKELPKWFINLFTQEGDWVLDPFVGSGTTSLVAHELCRNSVGIELNESYYKVAKDNVDRMKMRTRLL
jgi:site-specific DNA-methyltransferase (adenine-specific)